MKKTLAAVIFNFVITALTAMATVMMTTGIGSDRVLAGTGFLPLKYFTVESNLFMGIVALMAAILEIGIIKGKREKLSRAVNTLKLAATSAVSLTLIVVIVFLTPQFPGGFRALISGANLYFHLVVPVLSIAVFTLLERTSDIKFSGVLFALIPTVLYGTVYAINALGHAVNGRVAPQYDWYGFLSGGTQFAPIALGAMFTGSFVISLLLWLGNRKKK